MSTYDTQAASMVAFAQTGSQPNRFALFADNGHRSTHPTKLDAITTGRSLSAESFEVYDKDDAIVYSERPGSTWVLR